MAEVGRRSRPGASVDVDTGLPLITSSQRATVLSFNSLMASGGGVWTQPALGRAADLWGYAPSYLISAAIAGLALPFLVRSRRQNAGHSESTA